MKLIKEDKEQSAVKLGLRKDRSIEDKRQDYAAKRREHSRALLGIKPFKEPKDPKADMTPEERRAYAKRQLNMEAIKTRRGQRKLKSLTEDSDDVFAKVEAMPDSSIASAIYVLMKHDELPEDFADMIVRTAEKYNLLK